MSIFFIVAAAVAAVIMLFFDTTRLAGKIILTITLVIGAGAGAFVAFLLVAFIIPQFWYAAFIVASISALLALACYLIWIPKRRKSVWISLICAAVVLCAPAVVRIAYQNYIDNIPVVSDGNSVLYSYNPTYENNKTVTLSEPSTLKINSDFPSMDGATALYPVYAAFAKAIYPASALEYDAVLNCSTTSAAYKKLTNAEVDMIFVASASAKQAELAAQMGVEMTFTPIGREAFVFFVNSKNPVNGLTLEQIQGIYSGEITEWSALGAKGLGSVRAFQRDEGSGSQTTLQKLMAGKGLIEPLKENRVDGMGGIINRTADYKNFKNAIGYSFRFYSTEMVKNNHIKLLEINGVYPSRENIINNTYPICGDFYIVTTQYSDPRCADIIDWILSEQGQYIVEQTGYVGINTGAEK